MPSQLIGEKQTKHRQKRPCSIEPAVPTIPIRVPIADYPVVEIQTAGQQELGFRSSTVLPVLLRVFETDTVALHETMTIMHVSRFGPEDGSLILLLHGGGVAGWMWNSLRRSLESKYNVLVPDLPGHGQSADEPYRSHTETVDALSQVLSHDGSTPTAVIGFSLGAQLTIELASKYPDLVDRVMVVSAQAKEMPFTGLTLRLLGAAAPLARNRSFARMQARELFVPPELMDAYIDTSTHITKATLLAAVGNNLRFELPVAWSEFRGHALVMVGRKERALMRDSAADIHTALPSSEIEVVDGCGHGIPLERPDWFNSRVADWLSRQ